MQSPANAVTALQHSYPETAIRKPPGGDQASDTCPEDHDVNDFVGNAGGGHGKELIYRRPCRAGAAAREL